MGVHLNHCRQGPTFVSKIWNLLNLFINQFQQLLRAYFPVSRIWYGTTQYPLDAKCLHLIIMLHPRPADHAPGFSQAILQDPSGQIGHNNLHGPCINPKILKNWDLGGKCVRIWEFHMFGRMWQLTRKTKRLCARDCKNPPTPPWNKENAWKRSAKPSNWQTPTLF